MTTPREALAEVVAAEGGPVVGAHGVMMVSPSDEEAMEIAFSAGLRTEFAGAASCVWSDGTNCVTLDDLKRLLAEARRRLEHWERAALVPRQKKP